MQEQKKFSDSGSPAAGATGKVNEKAKAAAAKGLAALSVIDSAMAAADRQREYERAETQRREAERAYYNIRSCSC